MLDVGGECLASQGLVRENSPPCASPPGLAPPALAPRNRPVSTDKRESAETMSNAQEERSAPSVRSAMRIIFAVATLAVILGLVLFVRSRDSGTDGGVVDRRGFEGGVDDAIAPPLVNSGPGRGGGRASSDLAHGDPATVAPVAPGVPAQADATPTRAGSVVVRWRGAGGVEAVAVAIRGHHAFMGGPRPNDIEFTIPLTPEGPDALAATFDEFVFGSWSIGVRTATGAERWSATALSPARPHRVIEFTPGRSAVRGTVWGRAGDPLEGAIVTVQCPGAESGTTSVRARTGRGGRYEASGLHGGSGWFIADATDANGTTLELASHLLVIPTDGVAVVDVGAPTGSASVEVTISDVAGEAVWGGSIEAHEKDGERSIHGSLGIDGTVVLELPPAVWMLQFWGLGGNHGVIGTVDVVGGGEIERRYEVSGARVLGTLRWPEGNAPDWALQGQTISLRAADGRLGPPLRRGKLDGQGRFRFDGVAPGEYRISAYPRGAVEDATLVVEGTDSTHRVELRLVAK